jgi:hypothetical protein
VSSCTNFFLIIIIFFLLLRCGHIKLAIENPGNYGLEDARILQWLIRAFYEELWDADTPQKRAKLAFEIMLGSLKGKAIAVVQNSKGSCKGYSPAISGSFFGASVFVYTPASATAFRKKALLPFFSNQASTLNAATFESGMSTLFTTQLTSTITNLDPAKKCSLVSIEITTTGETTSPAPSTLSASAVSGQVYFVCVHMPANVVSNKLTDRINGSKNLVRANCETFSILLIQCSYYYYSLLLFSIIIIIIIIGSIH